MATIQPAASVIVVRQHPGEGLQVLLLQRASAISFAGGYWVFPGGKVEAADQTPEPGDIEAARRAAVRELHEEAGIILQPSALKHYSHWLTPPGFSKRFATHFFLTTVASNTPVHIDNHEIVNHLWLPPAQALQQIDAGSLPVMPPAYLTLKELAAQPGYSEVLAFMAQREAPSYLPVAAKHNGDNINLYNGDAGYATGDPLLPGPQHRLVIRNNGFDYIDTRE